MFLNIMMRPVFRLLACAVVLFALSACGLFKESVPKPMLYLRIETDKQIYRPGEMVVVKAELVNVFDETLVVESLIGTNEPRKSNVNFRQMLTGSLDFNRKSPVVMEAPKTMAGFLVTKPVRLEPGTSTTQRFAFVNLTEAPGSYRLWAEYTARPASPTESKRVLEERKNYNVVDSISEYTVEGPRLWERDRGIIVYDDAIKIAKMKYGKEVKDAKAILKENKQNLLLDWWVTLEKKPEDVKEGESPFIAYFISPYGAFVRSPAPSFSMDPNEFMKIEAQSNKARKASPPIMGSTQKVPAQQGGSD